MKFGGEDFIDAAMVVLIKTENKCISRLWNVNYPMNLSPDEELGIKNKKMCWICKKKFVEGRLRVQFCQGVETFADSAIYVI